MGGSDERRDVEKKNIHEGHRARLRKRYAQHGLDNFDDVNALELLLFYTIPRRDTNEIAHALLERFGSLEKVLEASIFELCEVKGVGETSAELITLIAAMSRRYMMEREDLGNVMDSIQALGRYLVAQYMYEKVEVLRLICLDGKNRILANVEISRGTVNMTEFSTRLVIQTALKYNSAKVILAHNHVGAELKMSGRDLTSTKHLKTALRDVGIMLLDHIIVCGQNFISMAITSGVP